MSEEGMAKLRAVLREGGITVADRPCENGLIAARIAAHRVTPPKIDDAADLLQWVQEFVPEITELPEEMVRVYSEARRLYGIAFCDNLWYGIPFPSTDELFVRARENVMGSKQ